MEHNSHSKIWQIWANAKQFFTGHTANALSEYEEKKTRAGDHTNEQKINMVIEDGNLVGVGNKIKGLQTSLIELENRELELQEESKDTINDLNNQYRQQMLTIQDNLKQQTAEVACIADLSNQFNADVVAYSAQMQALYIEYETKRVSLQNDLRQKRQTFSDNLDRVCYSNSLNDNKY